MSRFLFFQQIIGLVKKNFVGSPLGDLNPLSSPRIEKLMIFPASNASAALPLPPSRCRRRTAANAAVTIVFIIVVVAVIVAVFVTVAAAAFS